MSNIHPTAVIEDGAQIAASAKIGPFCVIGSKAKIGENVQLIAHVTIMNDTTVGDGTIVFPGAVLGGGPQDHGNEFQPEAKLVIGKNNIIRENVTMQCGTPKEHFTTTVGDNGMFMVNCHVAHDCVVGNNVIMTNNAVIGGHVRVGDGAILVREVPADIDPADTAATLEELAEDLRTGRSTDERRENLLHTMACKAAIKGGWTSDPAELRVLVDKVQSGEVRFCPHGRPVAVKLTKYELEKMFKRA